ncbi:hypothetical protein BDW71DRAFT_179721 [Aspergillus fruticulosus]
MSAIRTLHAFPPLALSCISYSSYDGRAILYSTWKEDSLSLRLSVYVFLRRLIAAVLYLQGWTDML